MKPVRRFAHLARRWWTSLDRSPLSSGDVEFVRGVLLESEWELWSRLDLADRRHSVIVARRFVEMAPDCGSAEVAAALLHDVGKSVASLSTSGRVIATIVAPIVRPRRFEAYYRHEEIGLDLCRSAGSRERTLALLSDVNDPAGEILRRADDL